MNPQQDSFASLSRRSALSLLAIGGAAVAVSGSVAVAATQPGLPETAFAAAFDAPIDKPDLGAAARLSFLHPDAIVIDHDAPFPMTKAGYADHLGFHLTSLQRSETRFHETRTTRHGNTAIVSAYFIERTKPKDAGFRLRSGYCTAVCTLMSGEWKAISLHLSPLTSQVTDASPG